MTLHELLALVPGWLLRSAIVAFGLIWGSFLNVVIYRVPRGMSVVRPPSHCPGCGSPIAAYDNIPVLSYVILRGRARCCGVKMSPRYPLVELIGGALSYAIWTVIVLRLSGSTPVGRVAAIYGADFALSLGLVAAAFIDAEYMFLPDSITLSGIVLGTTTATLRDLPLRASVTGAIVGFAVVWVPFIVLYKKLLGRTGMGLGDAKLVALAGAWFGWEGALFTLFAGAMQGTVYALLLKIFGVETKLPDAVAQDIEALKKAAAEGDEEARRELLEDPLTEEGEDAPHRARIAFGPFLILACLELLLFGDWISSWLGFLSP
ncbi:MAG: prepilin peptidase [Polyangiaceae bacterium]|nr:prepilin peptidase [Polyangiaceae bacterium]